MKIYVPDYYPNFKCIADRCKHNCCIGWEIDIDDITLGNYRNVSGDFGTRLQNNIEQTDGTYHFLLCSDNRCPFLNSDNLCDIIINMGEDALCQICADHPRFRNYFSDRVEIGLGMCCEAAAEIILSHKDKVAMHLINNETHIEPSEEDEYFFDMRQKYIDILQQRNKPLNMRFDELLEISGAKKDSKKISEWANIYMSLEHLDKDWVSLLEKLMNYKGYIPSINSKWQTELEQLAVYFIMRHLADGRDDMSITERVSFAVHATEFVSAIFSVCSEKDDFESLVNIVRMYSSEIEYSDENLDILIDICAECN